MARTSVAPRFPQYVGGDTPTNCGITHEIPMHYQVVSHRVLPLLSIALGAVACASGSTSGLSGSGGDTSGGPPVGTDSGGLTEGPGTDSSDSGSDDSVTAGETDPTTGDPSTSSSGGSTDGTDGDTTMGVGTDGGTTTTGATTDASGSTGGSTGGTDACAVDLTFDFEDCAWSEGVAEMSSPNSWECGDTTGWPLGPDTDRTGVWATQLSGLYADDESSYIESAVIDLSDCTISTVIVEVTHWYDFEMGSVAAAGGILQVSTDGGSGWTTVDPNGGDLDYSNDAIMSTFDPPMGQNGFTSRSNDWGTSTFDISSFGGGEVHLRLLFGSDGGGGTRGGWYVDGVRVFKQ